MSQGGELVSDPEFLSDWVEARSVGHEESVVGSLYWQLRGKAERFEVTPLSLAGGLSLSTSARLRLESGSWGSRLWFDVKEHRLCVDYRAPVPLRLELRSEL